MKKLKKCICLARVSTTQQELNSQTEKIIEAAHRDGYNDERIIIIENKESAVKNDEEHLLGISLMKRYIEEGDVDCVYCFEISRLSRRPKDLYSIRDYLIGHGIQLICLTPYFRLLDDEGKLDSTAGVTFALFGAFAEQEGLLRTERCLRGRHKKKEEGKFIGGKLPMGYSRDADDNFIINKEEAVLVRRIFNEYVAGVPKLQIARELMDEGYLQGFECARYAHTHIENVLRNSDYTGLRGRPQIISEALFKKAQDMKKTPATRRKVNRPALAQGIMYNPSSENSKKRYYVSTPAGSYYCVLDKGETQKKYISIEKLDPVLWEKIKERYEQVKETKEEIKARRQRYQTLERKINKIQKDIDACDDHIQRIEERYIMGRINANKAESLEEKIRINKDTMMMQVDLLRQQQDAYADGLMQVKDLDALSYEEKSNLTYRLISRIDLVPRSWKRGDLHWTCTIHWSEGDECTFPIYSGRKKSS